MRVIIVGPVTNMPDFNTRAFSDAEKLLTSLLFDVVNPRKFFKGETNREWHRYMAKSLEEILAKRVGCVITLPAWELSRGARIEVDVARQMEIPVTPLETVLSNASLA